MELSTLLNALVQGSETATLAQVEPKSTPQPGDNASGQAGLSLSVPPELNVNGPPGLATATSPLASIPGQPAPNVVSQPGLGAGQDVTVLPGPVATRSGSMLTLQSSGAPGGNSGRGVFYYGSSAPASASLLSQSGIGAYVHLLNAFASNEVDAKTATLTDDLGNASTTLKADYYAAVSTLPAPLQQQDWGFSVSNGVLTFTAGNDPLSAQDVAELQKAFAAANVATSARAVAAAITSIEAQRRSAADLGSLAWGGLKADEANSTVVNLRAYVTASAPGGNYHPNTMDPAAHPEIPAMLGGMDLRDLASARPNFFHANGSVITATPEEEAVARTNQEPGSLRGQCACGEVQFVVENAFEYAFYCHCSRCRLRTGSAFAAIAGVGIDKLRVIAGDDHLLIEGECADGYGARCRRCHGFLFAAVRERRYLHVSLGVLSGIPNRLPDHHIYVGSKAPWFEITDGLPQYEELPDSGAPV
jgi:hypothetical protein